MSHEQPLSFLQAAEAVLKDAGQPLHYREITQRAVKKGWLVSSGRTPEATLNAAIAVQIKEGPEGSAFIRLAPGKFGLQQWLTDGTLEPGSAYSSSRPMVPYFPPYNEVRALISVWEGALEKEITGMQAAISALMGTPKDQVSWKEPDTWIPERLRGSARVWAERTWKGTKGAVNPRYVRGSWLVIRNFQLLQPDSGGKLHLTERGQSFQAQPQSPVTREIDEDQGLLHILQLVAEAGSPTHGDLKPQWMDFLLEETNVRSEYSASMHLSHRLRNLTRRRMLDRNGRYYQITPEGLGYLESDQAGGATEDGDRSVAARILRLQDTLRQEVRDGLKEALKEIDPYAFERLIQRLMDAMGYQDTEVTSQSNDKGVDVLGTIKVGISEIREVVQVKRVQNTLSRPVLDQLRGSLYRFDAVQGTIITTGTFSQGAREAAFDRGAAPITLIDGDALIHLLIEHNLGVNKRKIELWDLDLEALLGDGDSP